MMKFGLALAVVFCGLFAQADYLVVDLATGGASHVAGVPASGWTAADKSERMVLKMIPSGAFLAGEPYSSKFRRAFEEPHPAEVKDDYYIGVFEVTQRQWEHVTGETPSVFKGPLRPVENISFNEIVKKDGFLDRLAARTGLAFDLPTEEQWERACRAGTTTSFSAPVELVSDESDPAMDEYGRCWENGGDAGGTAEVGSYTANPWGLYDMHGNVWEWTLGCIGDKRCVRGGGHSDYPVCCRSASRLPIDPAVGTSGFGLRVVVNRTATHGKATKGLDTTVGAHDVPWSASLENGESLPVHWARSMDPVPFYSILEDRGGTYAFTSFDLTAPSEIVLRPAKLRDVSRTRIRPAGVPARIVSIEEDAVRVRVESPCKFSLEPDSCKAPVFVFAEAPETNPPDLNDPKVKVIESGIHLAGEKGVLELEDGETLYLKRGAVLEGSVIARGDNIRICGRGIIDGSCWEWHRHPYGRLLEADHCRNLMIEDITIRGSGVWTIVPVGCDGVTVRNVKICNGRVQNDDGVDVCNSRNVLVEDCFFRTNDDAIALKGLEMSDGDVENVMVRNSTFWIDFARFALLGHESRATRMRGVRFENLDILNFRLPVLLLEPGEGMLLKDVCADGIRIDNDRAGENLEIVRVRPTVNVYMKTKAPGHVRDVVLNGLSACGEPFQPRVTVEDFDTDHRAENIVLTNSDACIELVERPVGKRLSPWREGETQFHFIHTGVGESVFVIYPDGTSMLIDCGDHEAITRGRLAVPVVPNGERHAGEWIARYVERVNPHTNQVDYLIVSHFHSDHTGVGYWNVGTNACGVPLSGFALAAETLHFKKAVDRGFPDYATPFAYDKYAIESRDLMLPLYRYLEQRDRLKIERFEIGSSEQFKPMYNPVRCKGFSVFNLCANGEVVTRNGRRVDLLGDWKMRHPHDEPYNENGLSLGMIFAQGSFRLFTAGDLSATAEDAKGDEVPLEDLIAPYVEKCDVAKITHHGYHSMTRGLLEALDARVIISPVWDQLHNTDDTLQRVVAHCAARGGLFLPTVFPKERRETLRKIPSVIPKSCYEGVHVVITVPSDANTYCIETVRAKDESMIIDERFTFSQPRRPR